MDGVLTLSVKPASTEIGGVLELLQHGATTHAETWNCGREQMLREYNCVWMIVRTWVKLYEPIPMRELELRTWTRPLNRSMSRREFDLLCDGRVIAEAVQGWVLTDIDTRRMRNMTGVAQMVAAPCCQEGKETQLRRPALPADLELLGRVTVQQADIDVNGHLNNAQYPRYALSVLPERPVREMLMSYSRECFAGDEIEVWGKAEADEAWLRGMVNGHDSFDLQVKFF